MRNRSGASLYALLAATLALVLLGKRLHECGKQTPADAGSYPGFHREPGSIRARDGHLVRSEAERRIDDHLSRRGVAHEYEPRLPGTTGNGLYSDFLLVRSGIYIEYWGMNTEEYMARRRMKIAYYRAARLTLIELWPRDWNHIEAVLERELRSHGVV